MMTNLYGKRKYILACMSIGLNSVAVLVLSEVAFATYALSNLLIVLAYYNYNVKSKQVSFTHSEDSSSEDC